VLAAGPLLAGGLAAWALATRGASAYGLIWLALALHQVEE